MRRTSKEDKRMCSEAVRKRSAEYKREGTMVISNLGAKHLVPTTRSGMISAYVQGDLSQQEKKAVFLTVHNLGCNHTSFHDFVNHPIMEEIKERSIFIHVDIPGQQDNAEDLPANFKFPTMQTLGEDLVTVLDFLKIRFVIGLGEGAGANILLRFGMAHPSRCFGLILVNATGTAAKTSVTDKLLNWKLGQPGSGNNNKAGSEQYLVFHKFGNLGKQEEVWNERESTILDYQKKLRSAINQNNLKLYVKAFLSRNDISGILEKQLKIETLLLVGTKSSYVSEGKQLHAAMNREKVQLLKIDGSGDVINEAPEKIAQSILLFCKGQGLLTSMVMPGVERQRTASERDEFDEEDFDLIRNCDNAQPGTSIQLLI